MTGNGAETAEFRTGLADSLMQEIAQRLEALAQRGLSDAIDLRSLPMTPADRRDLEARLGHGDVAAMLDVAGRSEIWETQYAGVWWLRHFGAGDRIAAERIEITPLPDILKTHSADIAAASARLRAELDELNGSARESAEHV